MMDKSYSQTNILVQNFIQRVYQWMAAGLALTGFIAFWASSNAPLMQALNGGLFFVLVLVELGLVFWLSSQITKISATAATVGFLVYSGLNGLTMSYLFLAYTQTSIASTFFITAGTFAAVSLVGWTTKKDLSSAGGFFMMALIGIIIASLVNMFLNSPMLYWLISYAGVGIFMGLTAYDTQQLKAMHQNNPDAPDQLAIMGALKLYLDFINMFIFMLRIMGNRR
jgi:FtsH-binding integral membrane protein